MKQLYAPWRENYSNDVALNKSETAPADECVFCIKFAAHNDDQHLILRRFKHMIIVLNLFPYNAGHLLILPIDHIASLDQLSQEAQYELIDLTTHCTIIVKKILNAQGINVGMNLGIQAGAGIPSHLHMHVLPRYTGDTNFLPLLAETKQISFDLLKVFKKLKPAFDNLEL